MSPGVIYYLFMYIYIYRLCPLGDTLTVSVKRVGEGEGDFIFLEARPTYIE